MCKDKQNDKETKSSLKTWVILAIVGGVIALWVASWYYIDKCLPPDDRGVFGDKFGAVNSLFSGLAFAGLIITLLFQKEELKLQREELRETRKELESQRKEFEEQNKTMKRQRFENTFFNMLSLQNEIVSNLSYECRETKWSQSEQGYEEIINKYSSREVFEILYEYSGIIIHIGVGSKILGIKNVLKEDIKLLYSKKEVRTVISRFDHCFRHLYHIFKYINESDLIEDKERYEYASMVRSQLSDYELVMLFYNCLAQKDNGVEENKFKSLIEKYAIFNNLRKDLLAKEEHLKEYNDSAYKK